MRDYAAVKAENERLKELLGLSTLPDIKNWPLIVIARDPSNFYSSLIIDKGYINGIRKYMPVVAYQDGVEGLVGKIIEVNASTSTLQPLYDKQFYAAARLAKTRTEGMISGQGFRDAPLNLLYIPITEMEFLKPGDIVVTSGLDQTFPAELMIGRVRDFEMSETSNSLLIHVMPAIELSKIEYVFALDIQTQPISDTSASLEVQQ